MRAAAIAVLSFALPLAAAPRELFRCGGSAGGTFASRQAEDWRIVPAKKVALRNPRRFAGFDPKYGVDSVAISVSLPMEGEEMAVYDVVNAIEVRRGDRVEWFRIIDRHKSAPRVMYEIPGHWREPPKKPRISLAAAATEPILRLDLHEHITGAHGEAAYDTAVILDFRPAKPRLAVAVCDHGWVGGAGTAPEWQHSPHDSARCVWDDARADFLCTVRRTMESGRGVLRAVGRHELLSKKVLSVDDRREWIFTASTPRGEVRFLARPSSTHRLTMSLFASHGSVVEKVPVHVLGIAGDPDEPASFQDVAAEVDYDTSTQKTFVCRAFTFLPPEHTFTARLIATRGKVKTYAVVMTEGERRALFWVGVDSSSKKLKIDALRVASTADEYARGYLRPAAISAATWRSGEMIADVVVEPEWVVESLDPSSETVDVRNDCALPATVAWSHEQGFVVTMGEGCRHLGAAVDIDASGAVRLVPRKARDDEALLTEAGRETLFARR